MARILVIDDDAGVRGVLKALLERAGHHVLVGQNGEDGLALARAERPELVMLDVEMPGMNGFDVCSRLKADTKLREVPVVIMTGRALDGVPARARAAGAVDWMAKPFELQILLKKIPRYLAGEVVDG
jgi:CheY-like chemotaxis protein